MSISLNNEAVKQAERLIKAGEVETFDSDWNEEQPTPDEIEHFIENHFIREYGMWFLGKNSQYPDTVKEHYEYPYGDLEEVQQSALAHTIKHAEKNGDHTIARIAKDLLAMIK